MNQTPKILTIIGLALEGLGVFVFGLTGVLFLYILNEDFFLNLDPSIDLDELNFIIELYSAIGIGMLIMGSIMLVVFVVNLFLFTKLIQGKFDEETARKVYTYQLVWGIINVIINTVVGIMYIVSAVKGRSNEPDYIETRDGI
jgi:ABC-type Na+ efflux pump permease subunit